MIYVKPIPGEPKRMYVSIYSDDYAFVVGLLADSGMSEKQYLRENTGSARFFKATDLPKVIALFRLNGIPVEVVG